MREWWEKYAIFQPISHCISETVQDKTIVTKGFDYSLVVQHLRFCGVLCIV